MKIILAVESDHHAGNKLGLRSPAAEIQQESETGDIVQDNPDLTALQAHLWELREANIDRLRKLAGKSKIVYVHNGDATHGLKHRDQLISNELADQVIIAQANADPIARLANVKAIRYVTGTSAHNLGGGSTEQLILRHIKTKYPKVDCQLVNHWRPTINGALLDIAHHGPGASIRVWLDGNTTLAYLRNIVIAESLNGQVAPRLVIRSHVHAPQWQTWVAGGHRHDIVVTPSMCGLGDFARQVTRSASAITWGMTAWEIDGGEISEPHRFYETLDIRTKEVING